MTKLHILGVPALVLVMLAPDAMAQRRGGGAVSGGVRGAMVGGLVGGSEGAADRCQGWRGCRRDAEPPLIGKLRGVPNIRRARIPECSSLEFQYSTATGAGHHPTGCDCAGGCSDSVRRRGPHSQGW